MGSTTGLTKLLFNQSFRSGASEALEEGFDLEECDASSDLNGINRRALVK